MNRVPANGVTARQSGTLRTGTIQAGADSYVGL